MSTIILLEMERSIMTGREFINYLVDNDIDCNIDLKDGDVKITLSDGRYDTNIEFKLDYKVASVGIERSTRDLRGLSENIGYMKETGWLFPEEVYNNGYVLFRDIPFILRVSREIISFTVDRKSKIVKFMTEDNEITFDLKM